MLPLWSLGIDVTWTCVTTAGLESEDDIRKSPSRLGRSGCRREGVPPGLKSSLWTTRFILKRHIREGESNLVFGRGFGSRLFEDMVLPAK